MSKQWRCAVVGTGVIGELHSQVLTSMPEHAKLVAVCEPLVDRAKAVLAKHNLQDVPVYPDLAQMLKAQKPEVVHVCTPSGNHMEPSIQAMQAGANVITEKPIEINLERIDRMIETSKQTKSRLACIFQNRWNPANRALYDAAQQNRFGRVAWAGCFTPWYRTDEYYRNGGWRGTWKLDGGGAIMNQSIHAVDLLQWIAGPVKQVCALGSSRIHSEIEVEDTLSCTVQFQSGAYGTVMGTTAMYPGGQVRIEIGGENGTAVAEDGLKVYNFREAKDFDKKLMDEINGVKIDAGGAQSQYITTLKNHGSNIRSIFAAWNENRDADTDGPEARKAVALILAMYESMKAGGKPVTVS